MASVAVRFLECDCVPCPLVKGPCPHVQGPAPAAGVLRANAERNGWLVGRIDLCPDCRHGHA
jgi:hypothetical protein